MILRRRVHDHRRFAQHLQVVEVDRTQSICVRSPTVVQSSRSFFFRHHRTWKQHTTTNATFIGFGFLERGPSPRRASSLGKKSTPSKDDPMAEFKSLAMPWRANSSGVLEKSEAKQTNNKKKSLRKRRIGVPWKDDSFQVEGSMTKKKKERPPWRTMSGILDGVCGVCGVVF